MSAHLICLSQCSSGAPSRGGRAFVAKDDLPQENLSLSNKPGVLECVILSTCIRFEVYAVVDTASDFLRPLREYLADSHGITMSECDDSLSILEGEGVVRHLFSVVCGLDSKIVGEKQIVGQVKHAYQTALETGCTGSRLNRLFQKSLNVSKKVRTRTGIDRGACSAASLAVRLLLDVHASLSSKRVLILGAGQMGKLVGLHLGAKGCNNICVVSRSIENARAVAEQCSAEHVPFSRFYASLERTDILVTATGAPHAVIGYGEMAAVMKKREGRELCVVDLADPPDVDRRVSSLKGISYVTISLVDEMASQTKNARAAAAREAWSLIEESIEDFNLAGVDNRRPLLCKT